MNRWLFTCAWLLLTGQGLDSALVHRYRFNEAPGSLTVNDSVGTAHGTLIGGGGFTGVGQLDLPGNGAHVNLPNGLISSKVNVTLEAWITWRGGGNWQRIFDIGNNTGGVEDAAGNGVTYLYLTPRSGGNRMRFAGSLASSPGEAAALAEAPTAVTLNVPTHVALVYDFSNRRCRLYENGRLVGVGTAAIPLRSIVDINIWLGRSIFTFDPTFNGLFDEFRIYDEALSGEQVMRSYLLGPERPSTPLGTPLAVRSTAPARMYTGDRLPTRTFADFMVPKNVDVTAHVNTTYASSNPAVLEVNDAGFLTAHQAGNATLTIRHGGTEISRSVRVRPLPAVHRFNFNETGGNLVANQGGGPPAQLMGTAAFGNGRLTLTANGAYVDLPNGVLSNLTDVTFEMWVSWNGHGTWQRIFDVGGNTGGFEGNAGNGTSYLFATPQPDGRPSLMFVSRRLGGPETRTEGPRPMVLGREHHLVFVYTQSTGQLLAYMDGALIYSGAAPDPLSRIEDYNVWLGRSNFTFDATYNGAFNEFRIYPGNLTPAEIAANLATGPDEEGVFVQIECAPVPPIEVGDSRALEVRARYTKSVQDVTQHPQTTYISANPSLLEVSPTGVLRALGEGRTSVRIQHQGDELDLVVDLFQRKAAVLKHRYTFNEQSAPGAVPDSVGTAHGTLLGTPGGVHLDENGHAVFLGDGGYIDLPNGLISRFGSVTLEAWFVPEESEVVRSVFDFGISLQGENSSGSPWSYLALNQLPYEATIAFWTSTNGPAVDTSELRGPVAYGEPVHFAITYNFWDAESVLYINGELASAAVPAFPLVELQDKNNWLGRSNGSAAGFLGKMDEFRIYDGIMSPEQAMESFLAGPVPSAVPQIQMLGIERLPNGRLRFRVQTNTPQRVHRLHSAPDVTGEWSEESAPLNPAGAGLLETEIDPPVSHRFYRVVLP